MITSAITPNSAAIAAARPPRMASVCPLPTDCSAGPGSIARRSRGGRRSGWRRRRTRRWDETALQRGSCRLGQLQGGLVTGLRAFRHTGGDHRVERRRYTGRRCRGSRRWGGQVPGALFFEAFSRKRLLAGQTFVQHTRERINVSAGIACAAESFGCRVGPGDMAHAGLSGFRRRCAPSRSRSGRRNLLARPGCSTA